MRLPVLRAEDERLEVRRHRLVGRVDERLRDDAFADETVAPDLPRGGMRLDALVQQRLRVRRLIAFVVPVPAISHEVDQEIAAELRAVGHRNPHGGHARLRVVGVDMEDRHLETLRQVARESRGPRVGGIGGEADLVVHDDVQRAAHIVAGQVGEVERLGHHTLTRERGVAVNADRDHRLHVAHGGRVGLALVCARVPLQHRIHDLEVARVRHERQMHHVAMPRDPGTIEAQVIFHIAGGRAGQVTVLALELGEDVVERLAEHVAEHIDAAAVRHGYGHVPCPGPHRFLDGGVEHGHERVRPFDGKALEAHEGAPEEPLEPVDFSEAGEERLLLVAAQRARELFGGEHLAEPLTLLFGAAMHELHGEVARIPVLQALGHVEAGAQVGKAQRLATHMREVGFGDAVVLGRQFTRAGRRCAERVELHGEIAVAPDGVQVTGNADDFLGEELVGGKVGRSGDDGLRGGGGTCCRRTCGFDGLGGLGLVRLRRDRATGELFGEEEELAPRIADGGGVPSIRLVDLRGVPVVEDAESGFGHGGKVTVYSPARPRSGVTACHTTADGSSSRIRPDRELIPSRARVR